MGDLHTHERYLREHDGNQLRSGSTADLKAQAKVGLDAATELDAYLRNHFRENAKALGAWAQARHIERSQRFTGTLPPPDSGSGTEGGTPTVTTIG